ncbi:hypothetical protein ASF63_00135 [Microbacterium sp. Leaf320]|nr:hypothetical protein ASF63_00135 [Microbacterium sp. Leaf320]
MTEDSLDIVRSSASIEEQGRECVAKVMDAKIRAIETIPQIVPVDGPANIRCVEPTAVRACEHQVIPSEPCNPTNNDRAQGGGEWHSPFLVTLWRLFAHSATAGRREATPDMDDAVRQIDVAHPQRACLASTHARVHQGRQIIAVRPLIDRVEHR